MTKREIEIIRKAVSILDSVDYKHYSEGKANTYLEYVSGAWTDERKLIAPILFPKFLEQILGFKLGETIGTQETAPESGDIPDYVPADTRTHPFVFDCKGMDSFDLSKWYNQIKRYLETQSLKYGILVNMRDLDVYTLESKEEIKVFNFNFVELYNDFKENPSSILEQENTKRLLRFIESFRYTPLTLEQKLGRVAEAKCWTGTETLNIELLTKRLHYVVERVYEDARLRKEELFSLKEVDPERARAVAQEVEIIALEIDRGREREEATLQTFDEMLNASPKSLLGRALDLFFYRVGYFTMTRLLLARAWEDIGFIDQTLYNGGLAKWYKNCDYEIRRVLEYAFNLAAERYRWLFNVYNNYTWYEPSDETLIEVLYELSNFYLGRLDQDVLGTIYEEYIDKVDKRQKGQYYTPREIVEFIWDRAGFTRDEEFFHYEEGRRKPRLVFDPVAGSGGFLVEAVRRIREDSKINYADFSDVLDLRTSILTGIFGSEISLFPYYITEVNLLIQLTPVIKRMMEMKKGFSPKGTPALGIVPIDALSLYNPEQLALEKEEYDFDHTKDLLPLESQKKLVFQRIKEDLDGKFAYCCANPPYVGEKGNKELFRDTVARFPYLKQFYQGKMDYLYFFIILGISKLGDGGKLGFITTAYWPTADGASNLRRYILRNTKIKEMIFFEDVKIFEYAKGQHNMIFILEKGSGKERDDNKIKIVMVLAKHQEIPGNTIREKLKFLTRHLQEHIDKDEWQDGYIKVFWSAVRQAELSKSGDSWHDALVPSNQIGCYGRIVALKEILDIYQGIVPNPDKTTPKNVTALPAGKDVQVNEGVFVLSQAEIGNLRMSENEQRLAKPSYRNSDICQYLVDIPEDDKIFLLYLTKDDDLNEYPTVSRHLNRCREILEKRREVRQGKIPWFSLHWPRDKRLFETSKIVCSNWGNDWQPFALQEAGFYERRDITLFLPKHGVRESLSYLLGLLNSKLLIEWVKEKLRQRGYMRQKLQEQIPIRRIDFDDLDDVQLHDDIVDKVEAIRGMMAKVAGYSKYFGRVKLTRLKFKDPLPSLDLEAVVQCLPPENRFSLRTHPGITVIYGSDFQEAQFILSKVGEVSLTLEGPEVKLYGKGRKVILLKGEGKLLKVIADMLENHRGKTWASIKERLVIPNNYSEFAAKREHILGTVSELRARIQELQESIDEMVFKLYGVTEELEGAKGRIV